MRTRPLHFYPLLFPFDNLIQVNETPSPPMQVMSRTNGSTRCCRTNRNESMLLNKIRERSCFSGKGISMTGIASTPHRSELPCLDLDNASSTLLPRGVGSHVSPSRRPRLLFAAELFLLHIAPEDFGHL